MMISIIIPVYNAEKTVKKAIDSVISQTYTDWELILIDDGSTDASGEICDGYANDKIIVFHKENGGVSSARNVGINYAKGEYIAFIDADDFVEPYYLSNLVLGADCDLVVCGFCYDNSPQYLPFEGKYGFERMHKYIDDFLNTDFFCYPWGRLFRHDIIVKNHISFDENMHFAEDHVFNWTYLVFTRSIYFDKNTCYHKAYSDSTYYHLTFQDIDYIDGSLFQLASKLESAYKQKIHPSAKTFCHILFQEDYIISHSVSEYVQYYLKYHPSCSVSEAYDFVARNSYHPTLYRIVRNLMSGKEKAAIETLKNLNEFLDRPWQVVMYSGIKTRFLIPFIKIKTYRLFFPLLKIILRP